MSYDKPPQLTPCVDEIFFLQAAQTPAAPALWYRGTEISYGSLASAALTLSARLPRNALGSLGIGVMVDRSPELLACLIGILSAGLAYVPLEPSYPPRRLKTMVEQCRISIIFASDNYVPLARTLTQTVITVEAFDELTSRKRYDLPGQPLARSQRDLAYIIFTSGSTGDPKGVMVEHRGVVNRLLWMRGAFKVQPSDRFLHKTPLTFDVSAWEIFTPLICGATVVLAEPKRHADGPYLDDLIRQGNVTVAHFVPSMLQALLAVRPMALHSPYLRAVVCSGEALSPALARQALDSTDAELYNNYGPTEASIEVTSWRCKRDEAADIIPIGYPLPNCFVEVLDEQQRQVAPGTCGELYLGGVCVARGYVGAPELTQAAFLEIQTSTGRRERMYRTGDIARINPDGALEFMGRVDSQIKIRGYRVELAEIERVLERHPSVLAAIAAVTSGDRSTIQAYVLPRSTAVISMRELQRHCEDYLPSYMWPSEIYLTSSTPRTESGKIDRKTFLASLAQNGSALSQSRAARPLSTIESEVKEIWADILGVQDFTENDNLFWIGGDSIALVQIIGEVTARYGVQLAIPTSDSELTVAIMASNILTAKATQVEPSYSPMETMRCSPIPLSISQERMWILDNIVEATLFSIPSVYHLEGDLDVNALCTSISEVVTRHEVLRTSIVNVDGQLQQIVQPPETFEVERQDISNLTVEERQKELYRCLGHLNVSSLAAAQQVLFSAKILHFAANDHYLLIAVHHALADGWSIRNILPSELSRLYQSSVTSVVSRPPPLKLQYAEYACWQRDWLTTKAAETELKHWKERLTGIPLSLDIPTDFPRPAISKFHGATRRFLFSSDIAKRMPGLARDRQITTFMIAMAAYQLVLSRWSGQTRFIVGTTTAGRIYRELEPLVGCFVNVLPIPADLSGDPTLHELLIRVRESTMDAFAHPYIPIESISNELQPKRDLSRSPLFQTAISLHNTPTTPWSIPNLSVTSIPVEGATSKYDLSLHLFEEAGAFGGYVEYCTDVFCEATVVRLITHLEAALVQILEASPDTKISEVTVLPASEHRGRPWEITSEAALPEAEGNLLNVLNDSLKRFSEKIAASDSEQAITYRELDSRSDSYASAIASSCGCAPGRIALLYDQEVDMLAALIGVLKAGKTYVPLDPKLPPARLKGIIAACHVEAILSSSKRRSQASELVPSSKIIGTPESHTEWPESSRIPDSVTYILHTSGTTASLPKSVYQRDRNVLFYALSYVNRLKLSANDRLSLLATYSFDAAVMDIFSAVVSGASIHLYDLHDNGLDAVLTWAAVSDITVWHSTPTLLRGIAQLVGASTLSKLRWVVLGGEEATPADVRLVRTLLSQSCSIINGYGPTEATIVTQRIIGPEFVPLSRLPVGKPIGGTSTFLLDTEGNVTDCRGELCVSSDWIAPGYWDNALSTAERFKSLPDGRRYYRSGDCMRRTADGELEFICRLDNQVKVNGNRVELSEIDHALAEQEFVTQACTVPAHAPGGASVLASFVVLQGGARIDRSVLLTALRQCLPNYMIPAVVTVVQEIPLLSNGKVDRNGLLDLVSWSAQAEPGPPLTTDTERALHSIWQQVLRRSCEAHDVYFEVGGDSLTAMWLLARVKSAFNINLTLAELLNEPTIAGMASKIDARLVVEGSAAREPNAGTAT